MSYIIWHRGDCTIFNSKSEKEARKFIGQVLTEYPGLTFDGWKQSQTGNNFVTILSDYDEVYQYDKRPSYLMPKEQH